ncbi:thiazole tautomerase TenI [Gracilibacillus massiliensis]|uniref:thiazole tautomerase TenI n=1 Tax=Gracilibacillus massiliensis TaxID=1564956 RepID=UPI00071E3B85|nr:thiazole tautomerase TenI [Gracilibacillus massiliensis]
MKGIHLITNGNSTEKQLQDLSFLHQDLDYIHIREKSKNAQEIQAIVSFLLEKGIPRRKIMINDRVDIAVINNCHGVQLAYHSLSVDTVKVTFPELSIGKSVHSLEEAIHAEKDGANFIIYGHIFHSLSKKGLSPNGVNLLKEITQSVSIPVIAIGGITPENTRTVIEAGASGIAIMSGVWNAEDSLKTLKQYQRVFNKWKGEGIV